MGNGLFPVLIAPGEGGKLLGQVLGSDRVEAGEPVELGAIAMVPVPAQLITPRREGGLLDPGFPEGFNIYMYGDIETADGELRKMIETFGCGFTLSITTNTKDMYLVFHGENRVLTGVSAKALEVPMVNQGVSHGFINTGGIPSVAFWGGWRRSTS